MSGFQVDVQAIGSGFNEVICIPVGLFDHQVDIQSRFPHQAPKGLHHVDSKGDVGNEMPIHNIDMNPFSSASLNPPGLILNPTEVSSQYRWCNDDGTIGHRDSPFSMISIS